MTYLYPLFFNKNYTACAKTILCIVLLCSATVLYAQEEGCKQGCEGARADIAKKDFAAAKKKLDAIEKHCAAKKTQVCPNFNSLRKQANEGLKPKPEPATTDKKVKKAEPTQSATAATRTAVQARTVTDIANNMVQVQGGTFRMGQPDPNIGCTGCSKNEQPVHEVTLSSFRISKYEVTQAQWRAVMGSDPKGLYHKGCDLCPVETVSWDDIQIFLQKLNAQTGKAYRLPTEAEWEFAARGGNRSKGYTYSGSNSVGSVAEYEGNNNNNKNTKPIGQKQPNELDLYDMSGNVWEWCADWYDNSYYKNTPQNNPQGPSSSPNGYRVLRGGSWYGDATYCRVADRDYGNPTNRSYGYGFRLVCPF